MDDLRTTVDTLATMRRHMDGLMAASRAGPLAGPHASRRQASRLTEVEDFGRNPGKLRMLRYVPDGAGAAPALVVALHGCTQSAASYDDGSGWSTLARRHGFALLMPEQQSANNPNKCFNWFEPAHTRRGGGEALSISQMIKCMIDRHGIDPRRVFIAGLSAGGAMSAAMLAAYPDMFAAGAVIAGLPAGAASNLREAMEAMRSGPSREPREWGDVVRRSAPHAGPWPRLSVWHGDSDPVVHPRNAENLTRQWGDVHGLGDEPDAVENAPSYRRRVWRDASGTAVVEAFTLAGMTHGVPLGFDTEADRCGRAGPLHFDVGISSAASIVRFFGIASATPLPDADDEPAEPMSHVFGFGGAAPHPQAFHQQTLHQHAFHQQSVPPSFGDPRDTIAAALRQAGLLDDGTTDRSNTLDPNGIVAKTLRSVGVLKP